MRKILWVLIILLISSIAGFAQNNADAHHDTIGFGVTVGKTLVSGVQYNYSMDKLLFMPTKLTLGAVRIQ